MKFLDLEDLAQLTDELSVFIQTEWLRKTRDAIPIARNFDDKTILDSMPKYLKEMSAAFREGRGTHAMTESFATAREHGSTRVALGYVVREVTLEYSILREILISETSKTDHLSTDALEGLCRINDAGLVNAVEEFLNRTVVQRERMARISAEHERRNYENLFRNTPEMICVMRGPEHRFEFVNAAHVQALGFNAVGMTLREAQPESVEIHVLLDRVFETGQTVELSEIGITVGTKLRYFNVTYAARRDLDGQIDGIMLIGVEVTDLVMNRESLTLQRKALELSMTDASLGDVLEVMTQFVELQAGGDLIASILVADKEGKHLLHGAAPKLAKEYNDFIHGIAIGPGVGSCGTAAFTKNITVVSDMMNDPLWANYKSLVEPFGLRACWSVPILSSKSHLLGTFAFYSKTVREPTPREIEIVAVAAQTVALIIDRRNEMEGRELALKDAESARDELSIAKDEADRANTAKSAFLANMSHEIRTPLGAVMGFSDLARQPGASRSEISSYLSVVEKNSVQVLRIIDDILDLAKVEAGRVELEVMEISLTAFLADFISLMGFRARENGITLNIHARTALPDLICADPTRLRQILANSVGNAIKFTTRGHVTLNVWYGDDLLEFGVEDTGRGISREQANSLFQAFVQADASTTRKFGGTGLGLVLTKRLCQLMGGDYSLESSTLGIGSKFLATVRIKRPPESKLVAMQDVVFASAAAVVTTEEKGRLDNLKVLLVEDSPDNQILIKLILERQGAKLDISSDGRAGVEKALSGNHDLVLMDIQMPEMDGHEAVRKLREAGYKKPVIALTAHAMKEEADRARESGFSSFLSKPIHRETLIATVGELGGRRL